MSKPRPLPTIYYLLSIILLSASCGCQNQHLYKDSYMVMGTFLEVTSPDKEAAEIAFAEIKRVEGLLSKYDPESEVSRLNKAGRLAVSKETFYVIMRAKEFWALSQGAFDITVGPLMKLWGFTDKKFYTPADEEIKNALALAGSDKIILHEQDNVVEFRVPEMSLDLGGIAKGYALDRAIGALKAAGIKSCLINLGGQIYCLGRKLGRPWRVAVRDPRGKGSVDYLELQDRAVATSGDYEQYFTKGDKRYAHILDPRTGEPAGSGVISVTVIAAEGITTDAVATAILVLGKDKGRAFADRLQDVEARIICSK